MLRTLRDSVSPLPPREAADVLAEGRPHAELQEPARSAPAGGAGLRFGSGTCPVAVLCSFWAPGDVGRERKNTDSWSPNPRRVTAEDRNPGWWAVGGGYSPALVELGVQRVDQA